MTNHARKSPGISPMRRRPESSYSRLSRAPASPPRPGSSFTPEAPSRRRLRPFWTWLPTFRGRPTVGERWPARRNDEDQTRPATSPLPNEQPHTDCCEGQAHDAHQHRDQTEDSEIAPLSGARIARSTCQNQRHEAGGTNRDAQEERTGICEASPPGLLRPLHPVVHVLPHRDHPDPPSYHLNRPADDLPRSAVTCTAPPGGGLVDARLGGESRRQRGRALSRRCPPRCSTP